MSELGALTIVIDALAAVGSVVLITAVAVAAILAFDYIADRHNPIVADEPLRPDLHAANVVSLFDQELADLLTFPDPHNHSGRVA